MALVKMILPSMGESIMEVTVISWLKSEGDIIEQDEPLLEVATDKVDTEILAAYSGILKEILVKEGEIIQISSPIALVSTGDNEEIVTKTIDSTSSISQKHYTKSPESKPELNGGELQRNTQNSAARFYSPLVLNIAKKENISLIELESLPGTGNEGRVTKEDILSYIQKKGANSIKSQPSSAKLEDKTAPENQQKAENRNDDNNQKKVSHAKKELLVPPPATSTDGQTEIVEMSRIRSIIAARMLESKRTAAHVTSFVEVDVTNIIFWKNKVKQQFQEKEGVTLTLTPIVIETVAKTIKDYPNVNISINGNRIIKKHDINIGMAVALPDGDLIVPVIKCADQLNLVGLTKQVNYLAKRARSGMLKVDELSGGTYTISNMGTFGNVMGTPIIVQPQVAILALGAVVKKPAVISTSNGDAIGIRYMMMLSHSYDHRVVDGALGGMFVRRVADYLEKFDVTRKIW